MEPSTFTECDACSSKPGMPVLCLGCTRNRAAIDAASQEIKRLKYDLEICKDIVRVLAPGVLNATKHTVTVEHPIPSLQAGDMLTLMVKPR